MLRLVFHEIFHRKVNFALGLLSVFLATALVIGGVVLLRGQERLTEDAVERKRLVVEGRNRELNDAMRRITKRMGFNIIIVPQGQNLDDPFASDYASKFMPEEYADRLAKSEIVTVNHLLPTLEQRVKWTERGGRVLFLVGVKGQVPLAHRDPRKPIMPPVAEDGMVLGSYIASEENLREGDAVTVLGQALTVTRIHPRRGDKRDRTAWIHLDRMQELFDKEGQINAIWALECSCALADVGKVREELLKILPDVHIEEQGEKALARAEARREAADVARKNLEAEEEGRAQLLALGDRFRLLFVPLILITAGIWLALLALGNVRERRTEVGLLNAIGFPAKRIAGVFLLRAVLIGLTGAATGALAGFWFGEAAFRLSVAGTDAAPVGTFDPRIFLAAIVTAPVLSALACWIPAFLATQQDPAVVLRSD